MPVESASQVVPVKGNPTAPQLDANPEKAFSVDDFADLKSALEAEAKSGQAVPENLAKQMTPFFTGWGKQAGLVAVNYCQGLAETQITPSTMAALQGWAQQDLAGAVKWVTAYETDGHEKVLYLAQLATSLKPQQVDEVAPLAAAWSAIDPAAASQWLLGMDLSPVIKPSLQASVLNWAATDPEGVSAFLATAAKGPARDTAIAAMLEVIAKEDPAAAEKWRQEISSEQAPGTQ
jgi:hypothetical protein